MSTVFESDEVEITLRYGGDTENNSGTLSIDEEYDIIGTLDRRTAYARFSEWIYTNAPVKDGLRVESILTEGDREGAPKFLGSVRYSSKANESELKFPIQSFSTKGGTAKKTQSYSTPVVVAREGFIPPNFMGGIGYKEGIFEGCDVTVSNYTTSFERKGLPAAFINEGYKQLLRGMTGSVNTAPFDGMAPGECLFVGADGKQNITNENGVIKITWDLTYEFKAGPNVGGLIIGNLPPLDKRAWDYVWVLRQVEDDEESKRSIPRPVAAYVEQVYLYSHFGALGIFS